MSPSEAWRRASGWGREHVLVADMAFAGVVALVALGGYVATDPTGSQQAQDVWGALLILGQSAALVFRRLRPWHSLVGVVAFTIVFWWADYPATFDAFTILSVYAATVHGGSDRQLVWRRIGAVVVLVTGFALLGVISPDDDIPPVALVGIATIHLTAALVGQAVYDRRRRLVELEERAERAEAERELLARQAVLDERSHIARELHDVVAHGMSVIVVQAGAAERSLERDPEAVRTALSSIQSVGRESLAEMRRMLGALRSDEDDADLAPQPGLADVERIVQQCTTSGVPTELGVTGELPRLSAGQDMAAYRVVQESLTNVLKHGGAGAEARVQITGSPDAVRIEVTDSGAGSSTSEVELSTGRGITGMRERVELLGGRLTAGPRPGGGFRVAASLPVDSEVVPEVPA